MLMAIKAKIESVNKERKGRTLIYSNVLQYFHSFLLLPPETASILLANNVM